MKPTKSSQSSDFQGPENPKGFSRKVIIYSLPTCPHCIATKAFLKNKNVEFKDINVEADEEKAEEIIKRTGQNGFPVFDIDGEIIIGFDEEEMEKKLNLTW